MTHTEPNWLTAGVKRNGNCSCFAEQKHHPRGDSDREAMRELVGTRPDGPLILPGAPDALGARVIEALGFEAVYITGAGVTNARLGVPDLGPDHPDRACRQRRGDPRGGVASRSSSTPTPGSADR